MNDSAAVAPMDERQPYAKDDYIQWAEPTGTWDECDDKTYRYPARTKSNWYKCDTCCNACDMSACSEHVN